MRYRWLLFDADGTLYDYDAAECRALERTLAVEGHAVDRETRSIYRRVNGALWQQFEAGAVDALTLRYRRFEQLYAELGLPVARARPASACYLDELGRNSLLLPGAEAVVRRLAAQASLALITNGLTEVQRPRFARSPITELFDTITISDELGIAKPDRRIVDITLSALGDPPRSETLIIGDSLSSDIQAGINAEIDSCWYAPAGEAPPAAPAPTHVIRSLAELPALIEVH